MIYRKILPPFPCILSIPPRMPGPLGLAALAKATRKTRWQPSLQQDNATTTQRQHPVSCCTVACGLLWLLIAGEHIPEHPVKKKPMCLTIQHLVEQVSKVLLGQDVGYKCFTHSPFTNCMVADQLEFFLNVDSGLLTLLTTDMLCPCMYEGPFMGASIIRSL